MTGVTQSTADWVPLNVAEIVTLRAVTSVLVVTANVPVVAPGERVTVAGTLATEASLLASVTTAPLGGAGPVSVTVPVGEAVPPATIVGFKDSAEIETGFTVSVAAWVPL